MAIIEVDIIKIVIMQLFTHLWIFFFFCPNHNYNKLASNAYMENSTDGMLFVINVYEWVTALDVYISPWVFVLNSFQPKSFIITGNLFIKSSSWELQQSILVSSGHRKAKIFQKLNPPRKDKSAWHHSNRVFGGNLRAWLILQNRIISIDPIR